MSNPTCRTCAAWHSIDDNFTEDMPLDRNIQGQCRLKAPIAHLVPMRTLQGDQLSVQGIFPPADSTSFCLEHSDNTATPWTKDSGFLRAPTFDEARRFFVPVVGATEDFVEQHNAEIENPLNVGTIIEDPIRDH